MTEQKKKETVFHKTLLLRPRSVCSLCDRLIPFSNTKHNTKKSGYKLNFQSKKNSILKYVISLNGHVLCAAFKMFVYSVKEYLNCNE